MEDNLSIIRQFLAEENAATGSDYEITEKKADAPAELPQETGVDTSAVQETTAKQAKKKRPALRVIEGGVKVADSIPVKIPSANDLPTPGGIAFLLMLTLFILWAIVPAYSGAKVTRLKLMWGAILGQYQLGNGTEAHASDPAVHTNTDYQTDPTATSGGYMTPGYGYFGTGGMTGAGGGGGYGEWNYN